MTSLLLDCIAMIEVFMSLPPLTDEGDYNSNSPQLNRAVPGQMMFLDVVSCLSREGALGPVADPVHLHPAQQSWVLAARRALQDFQLMISTLIHHFK